MSSVERRIIVEIYHDGSFGCPELDLMGYTTLLELFWDIMVKEKVREKNEKM
jgi:hypothetical protein